MAAAIPGRFQLHEVRKTRTHPIRRGPGAPRKTWTLGCEREKMPMDLARLCQGSIVASVLAPTPGRRWVTLGDVTRPF